MTKKNDKAAPTWSGVKAKLVPFDRAALLGLVQDLYAASTDNKNFLHARLGIGADVLEPYKGIIGRWLSPDVYKGQDYSVSKAKKAISDYKKAAGRPEGVAELAVFYCEKAIAFCNQVGLDDESYYDSLCVMFVRALDSVMLLPESQREDFLDRLHDIKESGQDLGWGVSYEFNEQWRKAGLELDD